MSAGKGSDVLPSALPTRTDGGVNRAIENKIEFNSNLSRAIETVTKLGDKFIKCKRIFLAAPQPPHPRSQLSPPLSGDPFKSSRASVGDVPPSWDEGGEAWGKRRRRERKYANFRLMVGCRAC